MMNDLISYKFVSFQIFPKNSDGIIPFSGINYKAEFLSNAVFIVEYFFKQNSKI